ncbi:MAG TPA: hypothetical protein VGE30_02160 [Candidatus Saccharimonadales bacterium]
MSACPSADYLSLLVLSAREDDLVVLDVADGESQNDQAEDAEGSVVPGGTGSDDQADNGDKAPNRQDDVVQALPMSATLQRDTTTHPEGLPEAVTDEGDKPEQEEERGEFGDD